MSATTSQQRDVLMAPPAAEAAAGVPAWVVTCLNCDTRLTGPYCSHCGQRAAPPHATLKELSGEALSEISGWDGKLVSTLKLLFFKPGELTRQFLEGRRAHFISPLRLYLSASVVFFLLAGAQRSPQPSAGAPKPVSAAEAAKRKEMLDNVELAPAVMRPMIRKAATDEEGLAIDVFEAGSKGLFVMLPVFAVIMMIFYKGRHFAEHLYFAIHLHAFIFAALDVKGIFGFLHAPTLDLVALILVGLWAPLYTHLAIVRVYGGSQAVNLVKELGISVLYAAAAIPVITLLAMWVSWSKA